MDTHWGWNNVHGVMKCVQTEIKGYVINLCDGLKVCPG